MRLWRLRSRLVLIIVGMTGLALVLALAVASPGSSGVSANPTCNTTLLQAASAGADSIMVSEATGCDIGDKIVLNQGESNEECQEIERVPAGANALYLVGTLAYGHSQGETVVEVPVCPTPTPTATPTPTPTPTPPPAEFICTEPPSTRTSNLQMGWNNFVWTGASGVDPATALACLEGNYNIAYRLDPSGQTFERYVPGRCDEPGLCNMTGLNTDDNLLVLVTAPGLVCEIPVVPFFTRIGEPPSLTLDLEPGWNNFVWRGASGAEPATALSAIEGNYDIAYRFDPSSRKFERYVPDRCEEPGLCNMNRLNRYDVLLVMTEGLKLRNPFLNSAIAAHGNTDWHIDTAQEFLFGTDMAGSSTAANHCPATWTRRHMHVGLTNTAKFYYDSDLTSSGDDTDATSGIDDGSMLFFYAGHGGPTGWSTLGNGAGQVYMSLGDWEDGGRLRYYWQCSCEVFAHGPQLCAGVDPDWWYACPADFDGSADSESMRNVYERWGPVLEPDLRMACGASTPAYCHEGQANAIWNNYNNLGFDVADSFIEGLAGWGVVPLCITMGGPNVTTTPLYDTTFTNQPNTSGTSYYHIQYLSNFASTWRGPLILPDETALQLIPKALPIFELQPMPLPEPLTDLEFQCEGDFMTHDGDRGEPWTQVRVNHLSGAVNVLGERKPTVDGPVLEEEEYIQRALSFIGDQGWDGGDFAEPMGARFMIATTPVEGGMDGDMQPSQKNVVLTFKRQIDVDGVPVNVLGEGGEMTVQMNNDGSVMNASMVWRQISGVKEEAAVKTFDEAYEEALEQLEDAQAYELESWAWGYLEAAGNVEQTELRIVFRFSFVPTDPDALEDYPPQMIEIPGQPQ
jgi:hypothetical protein